MWQARVQFSVMSVIVASSLVALGGAITASTDATWRANGPVGNLEGTPITSVGLAWESSAAFWRE